MDMFGLTLRFVTSKKLWVIINGREAKPPTLMRCSLSEGVGLTFNTHGILLGQHHQPPIHSTLTLAHQFIP